MFNSTAFVSPGKQTKPVYPLLLNILIRRSPACSRKKIWTLNPVKHILRTSSCWFLHQCVHLRATFPPPLRRPPGPNSMFQIHHDFGFLLFYFSWDLSCRAHDLIAYITNFSVKCTSLYTASHHSELTSTSLFLVEYISLISLFGTFSCSCSAQKLEQFAGCRWPIFRWRNGKY